MGISVERNINWLDANAYLWDTWLTLTFDQSTYWINTYQPSTKILCKEGNYLGNILSVKYYRASLSLARNREWLFIKKIEA
ncbi:MAG: hypothetical protein ABIN94_18855 [Ferruginibacter sp.]